jgi:glycosyltransferase involved in cell wall biosynthesis
MNKKIKLLVVPSDYFGGVGRFRSIEPHTYIQEHYGDEFQVDIVFMKDFPQDLSSFLSQYDLIHMHKQFDKNMVIMNTIKFLGIPVILDLDDHFSLGPDHPMYLTSKKEKWADTILKHVKMADAVTTTTPLFADVLRKYNKNVYVLPNAINPENSQFSEKKNKSERMRFGIVCGSAHLKDIELLEGISSLPKEIRDKMQIVLCGFDLNGTTTIFNRQTGEVTRRPIYPHESVWTKYEQILTDNYKNLSPEHVSFLKKYMAHIDDPFTDDYYRRMCTREIQRYATHYENVDVLLAPLKENDFNYVKSQLKVIEAGFTGCAIIAQNYGPYKLDLRPYIIKGGQIDQEGNGLLVESRKNHKEWAKYIRYCVEHPEDVERMKENLKKTVQGEYSLENITKKRVELYKKILSKEK